MDTNNENGKIPKPDKSSVVEKKITEPDKGSVVEKKIPEPDKGSVVEKKIPKPFGRNDARANNATNKFFGNNKTGATFKSNGFDRRNTNTKKGR